MSRLEILNYCGIADYFMKENGVLLEDENSNLIFKTDFISDSGFIGTPEITKKQLAIPHVTVIEDIYNHFRQPGIVITNNGVMICVFDAKENSSNDYVQQIGVVMRSFDMGETFETPRMTLDNNHVDPNSRICADQIFHDKLTNRVYVIYGSVDNHIEGPLIADFPPLDPPYIWDIGYIYTDNEGDTWSEKHSLKELLMTEPTISNTYGSGNSSGGIQLPDGTLVFSVYDVRGNNNLLLTGDDWCMRSVIVYSRDHGDTWHKSTDLPSITNEATVSYYNGEIYITARQYTPPSKRVYKTADFGETWEAAIGDNKLAGFQTQTSSLKVKNTYLFCCPASLTERTELMLHTTKKFGDFMKFLMIDADPVYGYSSIAHYQDKLFVFYERWDGMWLADISEYLKYID